MVSAYHQLFYHFVWSTYNRHPMIDDEIEGILFKLIKDKIIEKRSELICFGCTSDHIHLLVRIPPVISVSEVISEIKGYSSFVLNNRIIPERGFRWQGGYGALSVSRRDLPWLIKYVKAQKEHHHSDHIHLRLESSGK